MPKSNKRRGKKGMKKTMRGGEKYGGEEGRGAFQKFVDFFISNDALTKHVVDPDLEKEAREAEEARGASINTQNAEEVYSHEYIKNKKINKIKKTMGLGALVGGAFVVGALFLAGVIKTH